MASSSFQERVFSAAKRIMTLQRTSLGAELFAALVLLRHNSARVREWMDGVAVPQEDVFDAMAKIVSSVVENEDEAVHAKAIRQEMADSLGILGRGNHTSSPHHNLIEHSHL